MKKNPYQVVHSTKVYESPWIEVQHADVIHPTGAKGIYGTVHFKNKAIAILPIDTNGNITLVGQYRFPTQQYSWELPEGGCAKGEDPLEAAKRELKEETGFHARHWDLLLSDIQLSNSITDELADIFLATQLTHGTKAPDDTELLEHQSISIKEALVWIRSGKITDALTILSIQTYLLQFKSQ